jgi:hypothetical protein
VLAGCGGGGPPGLASLAPAQEACIEAAKALSGVEASAPAAPAAFEDGLLVPLMVGGEAWTCRTTARGRVVRGSVAPVFG